MVEQKLDLPITCHYSTLRYDIVQYTITQYTTTVLPDGALPVHVFPLVAGDQDVFPLVTGDQYVFPLVAGDQYVFPLVAGDQDVFPLVAGDEDVFPLVAGDQYVFPLLAGDQDAGDRRVHVRRAVDAVSRLCRLQLTGAHEVHGPLVLALLPSHGLHEQRHQPDPLQRHVGQVPASLRAPAAVW